MDLTMLRQETRPRTTSQHPVVSVASVLTGPVGILVASCALAGGFLYAVADLVTRLG
jgi:hypothetical protein